MPKNFIFFILIAVFVHIVIGQIANEIELQEAFKFSNLVSSTLDNYIRSALPSEAKRDGMEVLQNTQEGLKYCESYAKTSRDIEQYKICSSSLLSDGMAALGALQAKYRPYSSGASRISLFCL